MEIVTQAMIDEAVKQMIKADESRKRYANRDSSRRTHINVFNRECATLSNKADKYESARLHVVDLKIRFRAQEAAKS